MLTADGPWMTQLTVWGHECTGIGTVRPWSAGTRPLHAGTRRPHCTQKRRPAALHRVPIVLAVGTTTSLPCGARAMATNEEAGGRWPRTFEALRFSTIVGQEPSQLDNTEYQSTGVYNTFKGILRAQGHCVTASFLLHTLFCDTLGLPSGAYIVCPRQLGWTQVVERYSQLIRANNVRGQEAVFCAFREDGSISPPTCKSSLCTWTLFGMSV